MTIAVIQDFDGATLDQYERVISKMELTREAPTATPRACSTWVTKKNRTTASGSSTCEDQP